jgi:hypothetical protein
VDWASQKVSFPRFNLRLKDGQSLEDFILEVYDKVNEKVGESTLNEYESYKNIVKHKKRFVFLKLGADTSFRSCPPSVDKKEMHPKAEETRESASESEINDGTSDREETRRVKEAATAAATMTRVCLGFW